MSIQKHILTDFIFLFCLFSCIAIQAQTTGKSDPSTQQTTLKELIQRIEKQTDYTFVFDNSISLDQSISLAGNLNDVPSVLEHSLAGRNIEYQIVGKQIILKLKSRPDKNTRKVEGVVQDANGDPLIGANVTLKGQESIGTITDINGKFTLYVPENAVLQVSYIGFISQELNVKDNRSVRIALQEDAQSLDEVVVIGYGTARKSDLTGSVASLDGRKLEGRSSSQLANKLQGQVAGVQITRSSGDPSSHASIRIHGITTMSNNDPLVIVDGVPVSSIDDVVSEDVANIQILKDAASAAIYGSRAAAGVILITTKRAKSQKFSMSYNYEYSRDVPTARPEFANAIDYMKVQNELKWNDGASSEHSVYSEEYINSYLENNRLDPDGYPDTDWMDVLLKNSTQHQKHTFTLSGGTDKLLTNFSLNYYASDGIYDVKKYKRYNGRLNNDYKINNWIHANVDLNFAYSENVSPHSLYGGIIGRGMMMAPIYAARWSDGSYAAGKDGDNPLAVLHNGGTDNQKGYRLGGKVQLELTPLEGLTVSAVFAPNFYSFKQKDFTKKVQVSTLDGNVIDAAYFGTTSLEEARNDNHSLTFQAFANYKKDIKKHSFNVMVGYEDYTYEWENLGASRSQYNLSGYPYLDLGSADYQYNNGQAGHNAYRSVFGRLLYSFDRRYMLQANVRRDGSSRFAKGHRWATFPSISAGWVISEESWFPKKTVDYLKLRASVGQLGNERISDSEFPYQAAINFGNAYLDNSASNTVSAVQSAAQIFYAFPDITWETTTTYGVGVDVSMFNNRLRLSGDYYYKKTKDMLLTIGFPSYAGYSAPSQNAADMHTRGWDFEISWNSNVGDFYYGASFNLSDYRSKMGYMADKMMINGNQVTMKDSYYNEWYLYQSEGLFVNDASLYDENGQKYPTLTANDGAGSIKYTDINKDGIISGEHDRILAGNSLPEFQYGASFWAEYKNFDFNLSLQGVGHQLVYMDQSWVQPCREQWGNVPSIILGNYWSKYNTDAQNASAKYPLLTATNATSIYSGSTFWLFNGAYMRIKNISLGYTIPSRITKKFFVESLRVYLNINDLPAFSNYPKGWDPECTSGSDFIMTSYSLGVNVTF